MARSSPFQNRVSAPGVADGAPSRPAGLARRGDREGYSRRSGQALRRLLEFAFEIENGSQSGRPAALRKTSLYEKNPLLFWQGLCALLAAILLVVLARR